MLKEGKKEKIIGVIIIAVTIILVVILKNSLFKTTNYTKIYGAVGGGKEDFLNDEEFIRTLNDEYNIEFIGDTWSNGKTVKEDVVREDGSKYDLIFFSDQRFYDYYKTPAKDGEASRYTVIDGNLTLGILQK